MINNMYPRWMSEIIEPGQVYSSDEDIMLATIKFTVKALMRGEGGPFGATIATNQGQIISMAFNEVFQTVDVTAHAEVLAIRRAEKTLNVISLQGKDLPQLKLFTTCEPCLMCVGTIYWTQIPTVIAACTKQDAMEVGVKQEFAIKTDSFLQQQNIVYKTGFMRKEALEVFQVFRERNQLIQDGQMKSQRIP